MLLTVSFFVPWGTGVSVVLGRFLIGAPVYQLLTIRFADTMEKFNCLRFAAAALLYTTSKGQEQYLVRKCHNFAELFLKPQDFFLINFFWGGGGVSRMVGQ